MVERAGFRGGRGLYQRLALLWYRPQYGVGLGSKLVLFVLVLWLGVGGRFLGFLVCFGIVLSLLACLGYRFFVMATYKVTLADFIAGNLPKGVAFTSFQVSADGGHVLLGDETAVIADGSITAAKLAPDLIGLANIPPLPDVAGEYTLGAYGDPVDSFGWSSV